MEGPLLCFACFIFIVNVSNDIHNAFMEQVNFFTVIIHFASFQHLHVAENSSEMIKNRKINNQILPC